MSRYFILVVLGLSGGFLGEELGVQSINLLPKRVLCSDSLFVPILLLMISSIPFFAIASILLLKLQGYASFAKGFLFSLAYYLPFQYEGQDRAKGKIIRIAHLGYYDKLDMVMVISALEMLLKEMGHRFELGAGVRRVEEVWREG